MFRMQLITSSVWAMPFKSVTGSRIVSVREGAVIYNSCSKYITLFGSQMSLRYKLNNSTGNSLSEVKESSHLTIGQKVKQGTEDASYLSIIIAGIGITGIMLYAILSELFSGQSPTSVYTQALKLCRNDSRLSDILGKPIKGYGELSSRGRRRHVSHFIYEKDDKKFMRMKFYIEGSRKKGTVQLEVKQGSKEKHDYRYLFVNIDGYPPQTFILKDNRTYEELQTSNFKM